MTHPVSTSRLRSLSARAGLPRKLIWGYLAVLVFMVGDGIEQGFLTPYLVDHGLSAGQGAHLLSVYGITVAAASWLAGALSESWGPRRVMIIGLVDWVVFELLFLLGGVQQLNYPVMLVALALRGFGYPLFAYGFLVLVVFEAEERTLGRAVGWFWFFNTAGIGVVSAYVASLTIPAVGQLATLWLSLVFVIAGGLVAVFFVRDRTVPDHSAQALVTGLVQSLTIIWRRPPIGIGGLVRLINTLLTYGGFYVFLPLYMTKTVGFSVPEWERILGTMFASNIVWNLVFGFVGDRVGWRRTVAWFGGLGCAVTTLLVYYVPALFGANFWLNLAVSVLFGATLAAFVPLSALMPSLAPEHKGAAMAVLNLGAGLSHFAGPAITALFLSSAGAGGLMWIFAVIFLVGFVLTLTLPKVLPDT